ncbi:MAG: NADH-quinone oxidoreductase subunit M, partial [Phycisphaerae bacterium]|nr:NADH-quinone oxidoreductase subunit M [Phycisphaerae bacterium]
LAASLIALALAAAVVAVHLSNPGVIERTPGPNLFILVNSTLALGVDGLSVWLLALTALLVPLAILGSTATVRQQPKAYYALMMLLAAAMQGAFLARDLLWFYIFFEFTLIPLFFIIGIWGGPQRRAAATKFFIYTLAGTLITLATFLYMASVNNLDFSFASLAGTLADLPRGTQLLLFAGLFLGFAIKVPLFPLHTWLPLAHTEAPTAGSVLLAGVLLKLGTYGFLRIGIGFLPSAALAVAPLMATLGVAGIIYGALAAWVQRDYKRLIAYSSIAHLGFCMLGMFSLRAAGITGSVLVMVNHGISTGALFLVAGMIYDRYHTREFDALGGLGRRMPVISAFLVFFALSSLGLPGLNGFVSEFLVLIGAIASGRAEGHLPAVLGVGYAVVAAFGIVLSAVYLLYLVGRLVFGPLKEPDVAGHGPTAAGPRTGRLAEEEAIVLPPDASAREWAILVPLAVFVLLLGLWPAPVTRSINGPANRLLDGVRAVEQARYDARVEDIRQQCAANLRGFGEAFRAYQSRNQSTRPAGLVSQSRPDDTAHEGTRP